MRAPPTVRSLDYGGSVKINPFVRIYDTRDNSSTDFPVDTIVQPKASGATEKPFNLANLPKLPVDEDNDGMADSWEEAHGGMSLKAEDDQEVGAPGTSADFMGDGLTAFEEYRGFRILSNNLLANDGAKFWSSTNPSTKKDLFYWEERHGAYLYEPMQLILARQLSSFVDVWELSKDDIVLTDENDAAAGLTKSITRADRAGAAYPVLVVDRSLPGDLDGYSQNGVIDGSAIIIDTVKIGEILVIARDLGRLRISTEAFVAFVIAHEIGHKLGLLHPVRVASNVWPAFLIVPDLLFFQTPQTPSQVLINLVENGFSPNPGESIAGALAFRGIELTPADPSVIPNVPDGTVKQYIQSLLYAGFLQQLQVNAQTFTIMARLTSFKRATSTYDGLAFTEAEQKTMCFRSVACGSH